MSIYEIHNLWSQSSTGDTGGDRSWLFDVLKTPFSHFRRITHGRPRFGNVAVLGSPSDIRERPCESVENHPLTCESYGSFELIKISASDFGIMGMGRRFCAWTYPDNIQPVAHQHTVRLFLKFGISVGRYGKSPKYRLKIAQISPNLL